MTARVAISVAILAGGRLRKLLGCLDSLREGTLRPAEAVLVDNSGSDELRSTLEGLEIEFPLRIVPGPGGGYAEARNLAVETARSDFIAFIDDDCLADRWWLERLASSLAGADAVGGAVLPATALDVPPETAPNVNAFAGLATPGFFGPAAGRTELPQTANMAFRRSVWRRIPFPAAAGDFGSDAEDVENYRLGREDVEWWRMLRRAGMRCVVNHRAIAWHDIGADRFERRTLLRRAELDGASRWKRTRQPEDLRPAAADVAQTPFRIAEDLFRSEWAPGQALARHLPWARRQWSLLTEAANDPEADFDPPRRTTLLVRELAGAAWSRSKPLLRAPAVILHHELKRVRPLPSPDSPPRRILVVCYNFLGDAVLAEPMLAELKRGFPDSEVSVLCGPAAADLFRAYPQVDRVVELPRGLERPSPVGARRLWAAVRSARPDVILLSYFHGSLPLGVFAATDAPVVCWDRDHGMSLEVWSRLARRVVPKSMDKAEPAALMDLLAPLGLRPRLRRPRFTPPDRARVRVAEVMGRAGLEPGSFAVVQLDGADDHWKCWPSDRWGRVVRRLHRERGLRTVFIGQRQGRALAERLELPREVALPLHDVFARDELAALYGQARIALGRDSGPQHLAQAVGCPTVILFGPLAERRWAPMPRLDTDGDRPLPFRTVRAPDAPVDWDPEETRGFAPNEHFLRIRVDQVFDAAAGLLDETVGMRPFDE